MRFLLHGQLSQDVAETLTELGHTVARPGEFNLPGAATPAQIIQICRVKQHELLTASRDFVEAVLPTSGRREVFNRVLVLLQEPPERHAEAVQRLFGRYKRLTPGRLYTVTGGRVKVRQLPSEAPGAGRGARSSGEHGG